MKRIVLACAMFLSVSAISSAAQAHYCSTLGSFWAHVYDNEWNWLDIVFSNPSNAYTPSEWDCVQLRQNQGWDLGRQACQIEGAASVQINWSYRYCTKGWLSGDCHSNSWMQQYACSDL